MKLNHLVLFNLCAVLHHITIILHENNETEPFTIICKNSMPVPLALMKEAVWKKEKWKTLVNTKNCYSTIRISKHF
jgi:hypothetical protein